MNTRLQCRHHALVALAFVVFGATLVACASVDATSTQYVGASRPAATDPSQVAVLRSEPSKPHERLGEVVVDASTEPAPPIADIENKLRAEAAKMGADAVVVVLDRVQPTGLMVSGPWYGRSLETITGRKVVGVAIKYRT